MTETALRLAGVRAAIERAAVDALVIYQAENRYYVTGFGGTAGVPVVTAADAVLLADSRYVERARREAPAFDVVLLEGKHTDALGGVLSNLGASRVGFEADTVTVGELERLKEGIPGIEWVATNGLVERIRAVKSAAEIEAIRAAVDLTDRAMALANGIARAGTSETTLAWKLEVFMRENGAESLAFETIVGSGENGALPHHQSADRLLSIGDPIVIDVGAKVAGYCGDLTRTFSLGTASDPLYDTVYGIVDEASRLAISGLRPGMNGREIDKLARDHIAEAGYGEAFGHGLGHGVGLQVHELPRLGPLADDEPLAPGMIVTIEPGIYLPGRFGVRIEDLIVVRDHGAEVLSRAAKVRSIALG